MKRHRQTSGDRRNLCKGAYRRQVRRSILHLTLMRLSEVIPLGRIESILATTLIVDRVDSSDWRSLAAKTPENTYGLAGRAWHLIVTAKASRAKPHALAKYFERQDPRLAGAIERLTGRPAFREYGFLQATMRVDGNRFEVATSTVAHLSDDELHWYDVAMSDPRAELPERRRKSPSHHYGGFGLLADVDDAVVAAANERGCTRVSITVAHMPLVSVFERFGYTIEQNRLAEISMITRVGIPMSKPLKATGARSAQRQ